MSSNLRIKKICAQCKTVFTAKKTTSQCCSDECAKKYYKWKQRQNKIEDSGEETKAKFRVAAAPPIAANTIMLQDLINIKTLSAATGISRASLFRLMRHEDFPKLKIGRMLLFNKERVLQYLTDKYGNL
jgi:predicted DNA-binding transcriptional regulator AlpA